MEIQDSFIQLVEESIRANWDRDALTDYKGATLQYKDVARKIEKCISCSNTQESKRGQNRAVRAQQCKLDGYLPGRRYLRGSSCDYPSRIQGRQRTSHCQPLGSTYAFVGDQVWEMFNEAAMPNLEGIIELKNFDLVVSRSEKLTYAREHLNEEFGKKYPCRFRAEQVSYRREEPEELAVINYTSGTTGYSKE